MIETQASRIVYSKNDFIWDKQDLLVPASVAQTPNPASANA